MNIKILSDSTCDLSAELVQEYNIGITPLIVMKAGEEFRDGVTITPKEIFDHVAQGGDLCSTAALSVGTYQEAFAQYAAEYDGVIQINIGSGFSSSYQNACIAAEDFDNVRVVDSQNLSTGQGLVVLKACELAKTAASLDELKAELDAGKSLADLKGTEFYGEYLAKTDPLGADVPNPVSHVAYGYATQMCILDKETGRIKKMVAAHDVGKAVNPLSVEGQIEGGVVMSMGYALTEKYPIDENCKPTAKYGMLGLFRANQIPPEIQAIVVEKPGLNVAGGAIGIGEITSIPTAPAIADAYYRLTGEREFSLPLKNTPYAPKK